MRAIRHPGRHAPLGCGEQQGGSPQNRSGLNANLCHQCQRGGAGTREDVLTIVELQVAPTHVARPSTQLRCHVMQANRMACQNAVDGCRQPSPSTAHNVQSGHNTPKAWTFQASQNLRRGVSLTRWFKTGN